MSQSKRELVKVATMYYKNEMTQSEIAKKLGVSRSLISKLLIDAKKQNIVKFFIHSESAKSVKLELEIEKKYGLKNAIVIDTFGLNDYEIRKASSQEAAMYLQKISRNVNSIGVSWGKSLRSLVDYYPYTDQEDITVIPIIGGMSDEYFDIHSNQLSFDLARKMRGKAKYLYAPNAINNLDLKKELVNNRAISNVLKESRNVDIALVGIATPYIKSTMFEIGYTNPSTINDLKKYNVVGDINSRFFDNEGNEINAYFNDFAIGLTLNELLKIPTVMAVAIEEYKTDVVEIALKNKLINVVVLTDNMAKILLEK